MSETGDAKTRLIQSLTNVAVEVAVHCGIKWWESRERAAEDYRQQMQADSQRRSEKSADLQAEQDAWWECLQAKKNGTLTRAHKQAFLDAAQTFESKWMDEKFHMWYKLDADSLTIPSI